MRITRRSAYSGIVRTMELNVKEWQIAKWENGALIQDAMPQLTLAEREFITTGITEDEWAEIFSNEEE